MLSQHLLSRAEERLRGLPVQIELWNGKVLKFCELPKVHIGVRSRDALLTLLKPTMGRLAADYVQQKIDIEGSVRDILDLGEQFCIAGQDITASTRPGWRWFSRHSKKRDRAAISHHYDVSNEFYGLWLDQRRVYSCAYFKSWDDSLDQAQEQKLEHICRKLNLQENERFLDIGCGWGALIIHAAERFGVRATGITLSQKQFEYATELVRARGLESRVEVRLLDYRDLPSEPMFEKISSVGMFEHVGRRNLGQYFAKIHSLLVPGGAVLNHGITAARPHTAGLGSGIRDFIDRYVFPGGELVHVAEVIDCMAAQALECWDAEALRPHYAETLWRWVERLDAHAERAKALVGEQRYRTWRIYMAGSAHAFERGWMSIFQLLAFKPHADGSVGYPATRAHIYQTPPSGSKIPVAKYRETA